jgi:pimeloyl-ACP methyl ester carboxylesterase
MRFPGKAMVVCTVTDGSFRFARLAAEKFCEAGMPVIALGYWNQEGTPDEPENIPVEYMHHACLWLKKRGLHPGVWGISLGGIYALLCGSLFPEIECVVAASPLHAVVQTGTVNGGIHFAKGSPFSRNAEALPYSGVTEKEADIRVEAINGPVLLISGGADVMIPSKRSCEQAMKRLEKNAFRYPHVHLNYEVLSHNTAMYHPAGSWLFRIERKHRKECEANRAASWEYTLKFLREEWKVC